MSLVSKQETVRVRACELVPGDVIVDYDRPYTVLSDPLPAFQRGSARLVVSTDVGSVSWPMEHATRFESVTIRRREQAAA